MILWNRLRHVSTVLDGHRMAEHLCIQPGYYRLCKDFIHQWVPGGWLAYSLVRVLPARDPP